MSKQPQWDHGAIEQVSRFLKRPVDYLEHAHDVQTNKAIHVISMNAVFTALFFTGAGLILQRIEYSGWRQVVWVIGILGYIVSGGISLFFSLKVLSPKIFEVTAPDKEFVTRKFWFKPNHEIADQIFQAYENEKAKNKPILDEGGRQLRISILGFVLQILASFFLLCTLI